MNKIPRLVLTEGDLRNTGGVSALDEHFGIGELVTGPVLFRSGTYRTAVAAFEKPPASKSRRWGEAPDEPSPKNSPARGDSRPTKKSDAPSRHKILNRGDNAGWWQVLHPGDGENPARMDDAALVLLGKFYDTRVLLLSDLGRNGQSALLAHPNDLRADIVIAGLPDGGEPLCDALLDAVQPKIIVIADSELPATRRASRQLKERLSARNVPVIYTRTAGAVKIAIRPEGWEMRTMDGQRALQRWFTLRFAHSLIKP